MKIDVFLIGVQKAGTSSLFNWMAQHPTICGPTLLKDYHYWINPRLNKVGWGFIEKQYQEKENHQLALMGGVNYIYHQEAPEILFNHNPNAKLVLVLRNPVKRAQSAHNYFTKLGQENLDFNDALQREKQVSFHKYEEKSNWSYLEHGLYYEQISRYLNFFSRDQMHILFFEDFIVDGKLEMKKIFEFLEIDAAFVPEFKKVNETGRARFQWLNNLLFGRGLIAKLLSFVAKIFPLSWRIKFGNWIRELNKTSKGDIKKTSMDQIDLESFFVEDVKKLSNLLGMDLLDKWGFTVDE